MRLELKRGEPINGAIPGELYAGGLFFGYTLENEAFAIPSGVYSLYKRNSPKHGDQVHIKVPGRDFIMFHGANTAGQLQGCIGLSYSRPTKDTIFGDISAELYDDFVQDGGDGVIVIENAGESAGGGYKIAAAVIIAAAIYYITKKQKGAANG